MSAPEPKRENVPCVHCYGRGAYNLPDGSEYTCGSCNGNGTDEPFVPRSAEPKRERASDLDGLRDYVRCGTHSDWREALLVAIDEAERCAELERRARELLAVLPWERGEHAVADALAELLGKEPSE